jgi:hypothetical protein
MVDEQKRNQGDNSAHNKAGLKNYIDYSVSLVEQSQISNESEKGTDFDVEREAVEESTLQYGKLDPVADQDRAHGSGEPVIPPSMSRFCFDHTNELPSEAEIKKGMGLKDIKAASSDSPADDNQAAQ